MSQNDNNNTNNQEIDLAVISKKIGGFFDGINSFIFRTIRFFIKNAVVISFLFVLGAVLGYFADKAGKSYEHQIIVTPNFSSYDYLYAKVALLQSKINQNDTVFLKSIGIKNPKDFNTIEIEPIVDLFVLVSEKTTDYDNAQNSQNFELVKLLAENSDINKVAKDKTTSKNYFQHLINIKTSTQYSSADLIDPIITYLNESTYFKKYQTVYIENTKLKIQQNELIISQIDNLIAGFSGATATNQKNSSLVYYNENTQLNDILKNKSVLVDENNYNRLEIVKKDKIIKDKSRIINIRDKKGLNNKLKFVAPLFFVFMFLIFISFIRFYKSQAEKSGL